MRFDDAKDMLVSYFAFVNYLFGAQSKYRRAPFHLRAASCAPPAGCLVELMI